MVARQQQGQQFIQCFHLSMDDLKGMIKEAVKSVIPTPPVKTIEAVNEDGNNSETDLITPKEVCKTLKVSASTLWRYNTVTGILKPKVKIGRKVYYSKSEVFNFLKINSL